jgi:formate dehydrogenase subunit delta
MSPDKLVDLANQIGRVLASESDELALAGVVDHLQKYWNPRMRAMIIGYLARGGQGFDPVVRNAVLLLQTADWMK